MLNHLTAPEPYILVATAFGALTALVIWLPLALKKLPLSLPIVCIAIGAAVTALLPDHIRPLPIRYPQATLHFCEFVVIVALMGAGLKLDRVFRWRDWRVTWRLLAVTMPICIAAIAAVMTFVEGFAWSLALLLAASLAPTDPVLAADVQVGPPRSGDEDEVRFGLTSEAGLNDGLAFPFVHLAIALATLAAAGKPWFGEWLGYHVVWEIAAGVAVGWLVGRAFGWLTFHVPAETKLARTGDGLIALSATLVAYGVAEIAHCYGFLAVFVAALTFRRSHREHELHDSMHDFTEQIERLAMMALLLLFGGALVTGLLARTTWVDVAIALAVLLIIRPVAGMIGLTGVPLDRGERRTLAFFGIRGVGSVYYLAYGLQEVRTPEAERLWGLVGLVILFSIVMHGIAVTPIMRRLDRSHGRDPDREAVAN